MKNALKASFALAAAACLAGCSSYSSDAGKLRESWRAGDFRAAAEISGKALADAGEGDVLVWSLDRASALRASGESAAAAAEFDRAAETVGMWEEKPETLLSREALAALTDPSALPYRGRGSDVIMLHTYRALGFLEAGNPDAARTALNAAYEAQRDALEKNAAAIEKAREEAEESGVKADELLRESGMEDELAEQEKNLEGVRVLADYVNPFTTWLHGVFFLHAGTDASDAERARVSLDRVGKMYPRNPYVAEDLGFSSSGVPAGTELTYVVFESGLAPTVAETRADTILPIPTGRGYLTPTPVSVALPKLVLDPGRRYWCVFPFAGGAYPPGDAAPEAVPAMSADGVPASEICDMNSVVRTDFDNAYPAALTRALVTAFLKSASSAAINAVGIEYARRDGGAAAALVSLATMVGTSVYAYVSTAADVRCWQTLPQNFSVARLRTPESRRILVRVGGRSREVGLLPGKVNLVLVKSTGENGPLVVTQAVLK
ncbi:MAG: hypothetical protein ACI4P3_01910 [Candidatus Spyradosoma sp.]